MSANKTKWDCLLEIYANLKDAHFELTQNSFDKWTVCLVQIWKNGHNRLVAIGVGGTIEDASAAACGDYYDRVDAESCFDGPHDASCG